MRTDNAFATILMCSSLGAEEGGYNPYTASEWTALVMKIIKSPIKEPSSMLKMKGEELKSILSLSNEEIGRIEKLLSRGANIAFYLEDLENKGIKISTRSDSDYPARLKQLFKGEAPPIIYYCGDISLANLKGVGVLGEKKLSPEAVEIATNIGHKSTSERVALFTRGMQGVDEIAEKAAIESGGRVVSIMSEPLSTKIRNKHSRDSILNGRMLAVSMDNMDESMFYKLSEASIVVSADTARGIVVNSVTENIQNGWNKTFVYEANKHKGNAKITKMNGNSFNDINQINFNNMI